MIGKTKKCYKCKEYKHLPEFYTRQRGCKKCHNQKDAPIGTALDLKLARQFLSEPLTQE
jgi:hypothetical protein